MEAPLAQMYDGDVPIRVSLAGGPDSRLFVDIGYYDNASGSWVPAQHEEAATDVAGVLEAELPAAWLAETAPAAGRWRIRACIDDAGAQCSEWRMFARAAKAAKTSPGADDARGAPANATGRTGTTSASEPRASGGIAGREAGPAAGSGDPRVPVIVAPTPGSYSGDVSLIVQSPAAQPASAFVFQLAYYDSTSGSWVTAHEEQADAGADGALTSALAPEALASLAPGAVRWRVRARVAGADAVWSDWIMFGIRSAQ